MNLWLSTFISIAINSVGTVNNVVTVNSIAVFAVEQKATLLAMESDWLLWDLIPQRNSNPKPFKKQYGI